MLISKFPLYKSEWLDLVFKDRNRAYGAYELRQHYPNVMIRALLITLVIVSIVAFALERVTRHAVVPVVKPPVMIPVSLKPIVPPKVEQPKPAVLKTPHVAPAPAALQAHAAIKYVPLVVSSQPVTDNPPKVTDLGNKTIGPVDVKGINTAPTVDQGIPGGGTTVTPGSGPDVAIHNVGELDRLPEPYGGAAAWAKFLQKHLKYPEAALEDHMQGKVFVTFVVEKDGHLSGFIVSRGVGYGMDDEALRVLKLAPAWRPGTQNGQPVRVQYSIPINFQISDDNQ